MSEYELSVAEDAGVDSATTGTPADDAQAAGITAEELIGTLLGEGETAEQNGDGGQTRQEEQGQDQQEAGDKFTRRMRAALANQKRQIFAELGGDEAEVRRILREHRAQQLTRENPKISPEAAQIIVEEREKAQQTRPADVGPSREDVTAAVKSLIEDGWTREELEAFVKDDIASEQINAEGVSVRRAALDYMRRMRQTAKEPPAKVDRRRGVPTFRAASTSETQGTDRIAEMSDKEFALFAKRAEEESLAGRKVRL